MKEKKKQTKNQKSRTHTEKDEIILFPAMTFKKKQSLTC